MVKIERLGLEAVPTALKTSRWYDYGILQFAFSFNAGNFLVPALAVLEGHLSFLWAVASIVIGNMAAYLIVSTYAIPGVDYGVPGQFAMRSTWGVLGSRFFSSPLRALTSVYWFSVQSLGAAIVVESILVNMGIHTIGKIPLAVAFALIMTVIAVVGYSAVVSVIRLIFPLMIIVMIVIYYLFLTADSASFQWSHVWSFPGSNQWLTFCFYSSLSFTQFVAAISGSADICRYAKSRKDAFWGLLTGNVLGMIVTASLVVYSAIAVGEWNPFVSALGLTESYWLQALILCGVIFSMFSINLNNSYMGGFSLLNALHKLTRLQATAIVCIAATALCLFPAVIDDAEVFISLLGSLASPLAGIVIVDYLLIKRMKLDIVSLQQTTGAYSYFRGYNPAAFAALAVSFSFFHIVPDTWSPAFTSCLLGGAAYYTAIRLFRRYTVYETS